MHHYRKTVAVYSKLNAKDHMNSGCHFCGIAANEQVITDNATMFVVANRVAYDMFEDRKVLEHLLVIPKSHHDSLHTFNDQEKLDHMQLIGEYESQGYSVYARGRGSSTRSVKHQHTHLLKLVDTPLKMVIYSRKPYVLFNR